TELRERRERDHSFAEGLETLVERVYRDGVLEGVPNAFPPWSPGYGGVCSDGSPSDSWKVPLMPKGQLVDGKREGLWELPAEDGRTAAEAPFVRGVPNGPQRFFFPSGQVHLVRQLRDGRPMPEERLYFPDGKPRAERVLRDGGPGMVERCWHPNGQLGLEAE